MTDLPQAYPRRKGVVERPDCQIYFEATGTGPAIAFAHGLGGNHLSWWQQVPFFRDRYTCITFSHRGFYPSTAPGGGPDPDAYAEDLLAIIDHLGIPDISIVAQSMGGWTAINFALEYGHRLRALVLASTAGPIDATTAGPDVEPHLTNWRLDAEARIATGIEAGVHPAMGIRGATEQPAMHYLYRAVHEMSADLDKDLLRQRLFANRTRPATDLAMIDTPTLWLTGSEDPVFPSLVAPMMAAHMPRARHVNVKSAGHSVYFERPVEFNRHVAEFLETIDLKA